LIYRILLISIVINATFQSVYFITLNRNICIHIYNIQSLRGVLDTTLCDKVCQWLARGRWLSLGTPISSTNKTYLHDITEILLKVVLNTITLILNQIGREQLPLHRNSVSHFAGECYGAFLTCKGRHATADSGHTHTHFFFYLW
jgi:hypothetical protein